MAPTVHIDARTHVLADMPAPRGVIGPNAAIQLIEALNGAGLGEIAQPIFAVAGVAEWLIDPPLAMVDQRRVARLHQVLRAMASPREAASLLADAGRLTGDYLLANRIPRVVQMLLKPLPPRMAAALLVPAIRAHAWTFAGTGRFSAVAGAPAVFTLIGNPLCAGEHTTTPVCAWQTAVFQRLFQVLVSPAAIAIETECEACGGTCCRFVVNWRGTRLK